VHQAITLIAVILRVFSKLAMENATHPFSRVQNAAHYSRAPGRRVERTAKNAMPGKLRHRGWTSRFGAEPDLKSAFGRSHFWDWAGVQCPGNLTANGRTCRRRQKWRAPSRKGTGH
jgi:hypothetical protein